MNTTTAAFLSTLTTIETPQLYLKMLTPEQWHSFIAMATDEEIMSTLAIHHPELLELEKAKHRSGMTTHLISFRNFLLLDKETSTTIGKCGYHTWQLRHRRAEIGYGIDVESYKRKGLMTEAVKAILHYGFREMDLQRIEAFAGPANTPSIRLLERLGFTREGLLREHYCKNGINQDSACFGLLKREYELARQQW